MKIAQSSAHKHNNRSYSDRPIENKKDFSYIKIPIFCKRFEGIIGVYLSKNVQNQDDNIDDNKLEHYKII
jgi:hypothetical protein